MKAGWWWWYGLYAYQADLWWATCAGLHPRLLFDGNRPQKWSIARCWTTPSGGGASQPASPLSPVRLGAPARRTTRPSPRPTKTPCTGGEPHAVGCSRSHTRRRLPYRGVHVRARDGLHRGEDPSVPVVPEAAQERPECLCPRRGGGDRRRRQGGVRDSGGSDEEYGERLSRHRSWPRMR